MLGTTWCSIGCRSHCSPTCLLPLVLSACFQIFTIPPKALEKAENFDLLRYQFANTTVWKAPDNWFFPFSDGQWDQMVRQIPSPQCGSALRRAHVPPPCPTTYIRRRSSSAEVTIPVHSSVHQTPRCTAKCPPGKHSGPLNTLGSPPTPHCPSTDDWWDDADDCCSRGC